MHTNKYICTFTPHSSTFKISNMSVVDYNFKSRRGQRADENSSRVRGVRKKTKIVYSAHRASRHLAQRLGEKRKEKQTTALAMRAYTSHND